MAGLIDAQLEDYLFQKQCQRRPAAARNNLAHVCTLDIDSKPQFVRQTNIICTMGPSLEDERQIEKMVLQGMNVARFNLTLGPYLYHTDLMSKLRQVQKGMPLNPTVAIAVDITAPPVRTGVVNGDMNAEIKLEDGHFINLTTNEEFYNTCTTENIWIDNSYFRNLIQAVEVGDRIHLDEGTLSLIVREKLMDSMRCLVEQGGRLGSSVRCHIPRASVYRHAVLDKYRQSVLYALENDVDFLYLSFVETGEDVKRIRHMTGDGGVKLFIRIETKTAVKNIDGILEQADGVIICRGDLGIELPPQKVFLIQKNIIAKALIMKKPCLVAGQMMESMRSKPRPTRAEVSDVANAVLDGADGLILGIETSKGNYPVEVLQTMHRICREAESAIFHERMFLELKRSQPSHLQVDATHTAAVAAVEASLKTMASAIIVVTTTGRSAHMISSYRPPCPVLTVTRRGKVARQCHLYRGLHPVLYKGDKADDWSNDMDLRIDYAMKRGIERGFFDVGDRVVIVTGWVAGPGATNTVRIFDVPNPEDGILHVVRNYPQESIDD